jgi:ABC-2 type transport system permease protein
VRTWLRIFFRGGMFAYRGLFAWVDPRVYIPSMLGFPLFQLVFFTYVGRAASFQDDTFFVVGNAIMNANAGAIFGTSFTIGGERWTHTLSSVLATPANRFALFVGRALPNIANGFVVSAFCFVVGCLLLDVTIGREQIPALVVVVLVSTASCACFGLVIGSIGLRARDAVLYANLAYFGMLVFCGVNVPLDDLPDWMETIGRSLPLTHGIEAGREVADGATLHDVQGLLGTELLVGAVWGLFAYGLFRLFEAEGRRRASFETS